MSFVSTPADPVPEGGVADFLTAADGTRFRVARWCPDTATRGTVVILNGRTEFIEKYFEVIGELIEQGYAVASLDWRGQGMSDRALDNPHKGHVDHFDLFISDLRQAMREFIEPNCPGPFRALCHSMGGNITLRYLGEHPGDFESCVFSAPMWGIGMAARTPWWMRGISQMANAVGLGHRYVPGGEGDYGESSVVFENNTLTHDENRFRRFVAQVAVQPQLELGSPTLHWFRGAIHSMDIVHSPGFVEAIEIPVLVCSASADVLVSVEAQTLIAERFPAGKQIIVEGAKHELMMEIDVHRERFFAAFHEL
jgi:lysophospholipase